MQKMIIWAPPFCFSVNFHIFIEIKINTELIHNKYFFKCWGQLVMHSGEKIFKIAREIEQ